jgi:hypothetical protein
MTPVANNDTSGKFATSIFDIGDNNDTSSTGRYRWNFSAGVVDTGGKQWCR